MSNIRASASGACCPLLIGYDLETLDVFTLGLLTNDEVLVVDQDSLGKQATQVAADGSKVVYTKSLEDGALAVGLFDRGEQSETIAIN